MRKSLLNEELASRLWVLQDLPNTQQTGLVLYYGSSFSFEAPNTLPYAYGMSDLPHPAPRLAIMYSVYRAQQVIGKNDRMRTQ